MSKNRRASFRQQGFRWCILRGLLSLGGLSVVACNTVDTVQLPPPQPVTVQILSPNHQLLEAVSTFCANLQWTTCQTPEVTDDQAFLGENQQTYGPPAFIAPAQDLNNHTSEAAFQAAPVLVGYVYVLPSQGLLPKTYTDLRLNYGHNCLYLWHVSGSFRAFVDQPTANTCGAYAADTADQLEVLAVASTGFPNHTDVPPVARFHEGNKGPTAGVPFLGGKCGNKWCLVLPIREVGVNMSEWVPPHAGVHNDRRTWAVYGWNDTQHLAIANPLGGLMRSNMRLSVVAVPNLASITEAQYEQGFQHVATVFVRGSVSGKYKNTWHFSPGKNEVYIRKNANQVWVGEIHSRGQIGPFSWGTRITPVTVTRRDHGHPIPGTARFLWTVTDEDLWIECDDGCCRVSG